MRGGKDFTHWFWRKLGAGLAHGSYLQSRLYHRLSFLPTQDLNRFQRRWAVLRRIPKGLLIGPYRLLVRVLRGKFLLIALEAVQFYKIRWRAAVYHVRLEPWREGMAVPLAQIWNDAFPNHRTTPERLEQRVFKSADFDPSQCWIMRQGKTWVGWGFTSIWQRGAATQETPQIEWLAVASAGWKTGSGELLLHKLIHSIDKDRLFQQIRYGPVPVVLKDDVLFLEGCSALAGQRGFRPGEIMTELSVDRQQYRSPGKKPNASRLQIRSWKPGDEVRLRDQFMAKEYNQNILQRHLALKGNPDRILLAFDKDRPVGICFGLPDEEVCSSRHLGGWIWSLASSEAKRGYLFHCVVDIRFRGQGIGSALTDACLERLFGMGCEEVWLWSHVGAWFRRFGFEPRDQFVTLLRQQEV